MARDSTESGREMSRRDLFKLVTPRGGLLTRTIVLLDKDLCSACTLCARDCPNSAITVSGDAGVRLSFLASLCDACGICAEICPEKCLRLSQSPVQGEANVVLFQDELARCERCGSVIGSRAMIKRVRAKLQAGDESLAAKIQLCPGCKGKSS